MIQRSHKHLHPHHIYQLEIIFLFVIGFILFFTYFLIIDTKGLDMAVYQWYFTLPWALIYTAWGLKLRGRIPKGERVSPLKRPIIHWVLLGIAIEREASQFAELGKGEGRAKADTATSDLCGCANRLGQTG